MKSQTQTLVLVAVLIGIIGGLAFISNWIWTKSSDRKESEDETMGLEIEFPVKAVEGYPIYEAHSRGHHDFLFHNNNAQPVELGAEWKNCQCSQVKVLVLGPEEERKIRIQFPAAAAALVPNAAGGGLILLGTLTGFHHQVHGSLEAPERWTVLMDESSGRQTSTSDESTLGVLIPENASGFVRLAWRGEKPGSKALLAKVWVQAPGNPKTRGEKTDLMINAVLVPPVQVQPEKIDVSNLNPGERHDFELLCWSATRPGFKLESVREETGNPCFVTSCTPLTGDDLARAVATQSEKGPVRMLTAYRIKGTVYERAAGNGPALDLGPFVHYLALTTDQPEVPPVRVPISGTVRGDITVGTDEARDRIVLKTFVRTKDKEEVVPVETNQPGLGLHVAGWEPKYLEVELKEKGTQADGRRRWTLRVKVPRNKASGLMPPDSAVILETDSQPPRRIRVPIIGRATNP